MFSIGSGDSGGPLVCNLGKRSQCLAGATSFGTVPCGQPGIPDVYANMAKVQSFFKS